MAATEQGNHPLGRKRPKPGKLVNPALSSQSTPSWATVKVGEYGISNKWCLTPNVYLPMTQRMHKTHPVIVDTWTHPLVPSIMPKCAIRIDNLGKWQNLPFYQVWFLLEHPLAVSPSWTWHRWHSLPQILLTLLFHQYLPQDGWSQIRAPPPWPYRYFGLDNSCIVKCLAASRTPSHWMPVAWPLQLWQRLHAFPNVLGRTTLFLVERLKWHEISLIRGWPHLCWSSRYDFLN